MHKILAKLFGNAGTGVADKISGIVDRFVHTKDEKAQFIKEMDKMWINAEADMQKNVTERWQADLQHGNWLTRSVRPIVLVFLIVFTVDGEWKELLKILLMTTVAAYFGGRSYEKGQKIKNK